MTPQLNGHLLPPLRGRADLLPPPETFAYPERVLQFGSGALLRGLVEPVIESANRRGAFRGRVVVVTQTASGRAKAFNDQDGVYTLRVEGIDGGRAVQRTAVIAAVSRALSAQQEWDAVLNVARQVELGLVVSNTTEVGIRWDDGDNPNAAPPRSFPAKLAAFLRERAEAFDFADESGLVVLPCELIRDNGDRLRSLVLRWGSRGDFGERFEAWVRSSCRFPNTLVDRIVPGIPDADRLHQLEAELGYRDALLTTCEPYRLWAIEGDEELRRRLPFVEADADEPGIVVVPDVTPYRLRKVRLLNGTHTLMVPVALACGHRTVREAVEDDLTGAYVRRLMFDEAVPAVEAEDGVPSGSARPFASAVLDRFANPFIRHELVAITLQHTMKLGVRVAPTVLMHHRMTGKPPEAIAFGFAAYLLMQRAAAGHDARPFGTGFAPLADDRAGPVRRRWSGVDPGAARSVGDLVRDVLGDEALWGADLSAPLGFAEAVSRHLTRCLSEGVATALAALLDTKDSDLDGLSPHARTPRSQ